VMRVLLVKQPDKDVGVRGYRSHSPRKVSR
jgi:hypothetical protein